MKKLVMTGMIRKSRPMTLISLNLVSREAGPVTLTVTTETDRLRKGMTLTVEHLDQIHQTVTGKSLRRVMMMTGETLMDKANQMIHQVTASLMVNRNPTTEATMPPESAPKT